MDSSQRPDPTALRAWLQLPGGALSAGQLAIGGARAVVFTSDDALFDSWPEDQPGKLLVGDDPQTAASYPVALNGMAGNGLDLTITGAFTAAAAAGLGMPADFPYDSAGAGRLLAHFMDDGTGQLEDLLRAYLVDLGDRLFELATTPGRGTYDRQQYHDALGFLKRDSDTLVGTFRKRLATSLANPERDAGDGTTDAMATALGLVGFMEMEERLAIDRMVSEALDRYRLELEALTLRTGDLLGFGAAGVKTPFHPLYLCRAVDEGLRAVGFAEAPLVDALNLFHRLVMRCLDGFYGALNGKLAASGLRPDLEKALNRTGSILHRTSEHTPHLKEQAPGESDTPEPSGATEQGDQRHRSARSERRVASGPRRSSGMGGRTAQQPRLEPKELHSALQHALVRPENPGAGERASEEELEAMLARLQHQEPAAASSLRERLDAEGSEPGSNADGQLAFVDSVFERLGRGDVINARLQPDLERLRVPLARLALREPTVFADAENPAHQVIDALARLAAPGNYPNPGLARRIAALTERIATDYDGDAEVFERAGEELGDLLAQQEGTVERNVQRVVDGMAGQEQLRAAHRHVAAFIADTLGGERAPRALLELLDAGFRDLLVQTALREGTDSHDWAQLAGRLGELRSVLQAAGDGDGDLARARAVQPAVREVDEAIRAAQPGNVAHSAVLREILDIAGGQQPLETSPAPEPPADGTIPEARLDDLPRLRRWLKRVEDLRAGTVISYRGADGERRRMRLAWISKDGERYVFVNDQGRKIAELSRLQLARKLSHGLKPPAPVEGMSLLHRSVFDTLAGAREELGAARERDAVTTLPGDRRLLKELERAVQHAQQQEARHGFLCLAIDAFHLVDELYDQVDGDRILAEFAQRLSRLHERRSLTGRLGDDQFGILLLYRDREESLALAETLCGDFAREPLEVAGEAITFTVSIGVSPIDVATDSAASVLEVARGALDEARGAGGNRALAAAPARPGEGQAGRDRAARQAAVRDAIGEERLMLRAQPIVRRAADDAQPTSRHYEVLLAVRGEDGEPVSPGPFIEEAERAGAMGLVDRWVIREVCAWISTLMDRQRQVPEVSVNLSGQSLRDDDFTDYVLAQLSEFGVGTSKLCFEFTEAGAAENLTKAADFVRTLGNVGCKFSLDDYGSNPADHDYLRQLPVDYVKIDGSLVRQIHENEADRALVRAINDLAHFLGQETIAECVETPEAVAPLQEIGIDLLQGWGVGMPRSLDEVARELRPLET
ncbi:DUF1631 family protein [Pseudohaliea rubra]|uniref:Uncharacterized protein n=1 Tax=Pseudohaliea rubra DSM 19751 TaxID=1265313 RepID=A0A095XUH2_9GAMM|nr:DUF1631 family protein [Pseudohaliea rubra]KGE03341.1 hypothetical protein HRUBRA_02091 [Pseudohaliea rubra DSM 19751]